MAEEETLSELEDSVLSLCNDEDTVVEDKFHLSPSKLTGIQLPIYTTPASAIDGLSPITVKKNYTPWCNTPFRSRTKRDHENMSSTPCSSSVPKRLRLSESKLVTISEDLESFDDLLQSVSELCEKPTAPTNNISRIDLENICEEGKKNNIPNKNYFKKEKSVEPRFKLVDYTRSIVGLKDDDNDDDNDGEVTEDILGLDDYFVLDVASSDDDDKLDLTYSDTDETIVDKKKLEVVDTPLMTDVVPQQSRLDNENLPEAVPTTSSKSVTESPKKIKVEPKIISSVQIKNNEEKIVAKVTPLVHNVRIPSPPLEDSIIEVIMVDASIEYVDLTDDTLPVTDNTVKESSPPTLTQSDHIRQPENQTAPIPTTLENQTPLPTILPKSDCIKKTEIQPDSTAQSTAKITAPVGITKTDEDRLVETIKKSWGKDGIHNFNNNLTVCQAYRKKTGKVDASSELEGNCRVPPLFRTSIKENDFHFTGQGRTPADIASGIRQQLFSIDVDCNNNIQEIEHNTEIRVDYLKNIHRNQILMLQSRQLVELRSLVALRRMNPNSYMVQCRSMQLREDHLGQKDMLKFRHNEEMRNLMNEIHFEKEQVYLKASESKQNLSHIMDKLMSTEKQYPVNPDMVHTTVDLYKGPCRSNGFTQSLVQVCLPADIASHMIREDEVYSMHYKYD